jgi:broad specificity phosphatase PhoE
MFDLFIMRHGQSEADLLDRYEGRADFPLTDLGREQADWPARGSRSASASTV